MCDTRWTARAEGVNDGINYRNAGKALRETIDKRPKPYSQTVVEGTTIFSSVATICEAQAGRPVLCNV